MKKLILFALLTSALFIISCGSDDDDGNEFSGCVVCTNTVATIETSTEYCDNEDGTVTKNPGETDENVITISAASFSEFVQGILDNFGGTCTQQ